LMDKAKIVLLVIIGILTVAMFLLGERLFAVMAIAIEVLIAVIGLPNMIRKRTRYKRTDQNY
jgi:Flp pilus assembly protein TadB